MSCGLEWWDSYKRYKTDIPLDVGFSRISGINTHKVNRDLKEFINVR